MSIEVEVLIETYTILKQFIPAKDRQESTDSLMSVLVDLLSDKDLDEFAETDAYLKRSFKEYTHSDDDDDDRYDENE